MQHLYGQHAERITEALRNAPGNTLCAYDLGQAVGIDSAVFYPVAHRMEAEGVLSSAWDETVKPRRRVYTLRIQEIPYG